MLEPYDGKLSSTVLRGERGSNASDLPDMNSRLCWWFLKNTGTVLANGYYRYKPAYLKPMPIPNVSIETDSAIRTMIKNLLVLKDEKEKKIVADKIEQEVFSLYGLNKDEISIVIL